MIQILHTWTKINQSAVNSMQKILHSKAVDRNQLDFDKM